MGRRNLTVVIADGKERIAQYGQCDGHWSGQGVTALAFARNRLPNADGRAWFRDQLRRVRLLSNEEVRKLWADFVVTSERANVVQADAFYKKWPYLSRDLGSKILDLVWEATGEVTLRNALTFASDSLFCEYAYVIDLDKSSLEAYKGFNQAPVPAGERFAQFTNSGPDSEYYPIRHVRSWSLDGLPSEAGFLEELDRLTRDETDGES